MYRRSDGSVPLYVAQAPTESRIQIPIQILVEITAQIPLQTLIPIHPYRHGYDYGYGCVHLGKNRTRLGGVACFSGTVPGGPLAPLGALLDRFHFFFAPLWAPLGAVQARSGSPRRPPRSILEAP